MTGDRVIGDDAITEYDDVVGFPPHEFSRAEMESVDRKEAVCCRHCGLPFHIITPLTEGENVDFC